MESSCQNEYRSHYKSGSCKKQISSITTLKIEPYKHQTKVWSVINIPSTLFKPIRNTNIMETLNQLYRELEITTLPSKTKKARFLNFQGHIQSLLLKNFSNLSPCTSEEESYKPNGNSNTLQLPFLTQSNPEEYLMYLVFLLLIIMIYGVRYANKIITFYFDNVKSISFKMPKNQRDLVFILGIGIQLMITGKINESQQSIKAAISSDTIAIPQSTHHILKEVLKRTIDPSEDCTVASIYENIKDYLTTT